MTWGLDPIYSLSSLLVFGAAHVADRPMCIFRCQLRHRQPLVLRGLPARRRAAKATRIFPIRLGIAHKALMILIALPKLFSPILRYAIPTKEADGATKEPSQARQPRGNRLWHSQLLPLPLLKQATGVILRSSLLQLPSYPVTRNPGNLVRSHYYQTRHSLQIHI